MENGHVATQRLQQEDKTTNLTVSERARERTRENERGCVFFITNSVPAVSLSVWIWRAYLQRCCRKCRLAVAATSKKASACVCPCVCGGFC